MWAGRGRVVSTQAMAWETWVQACWKAVWGFCKFLPFFGKNPQKLPKKKKIFFFLPLFLFWYLSARPAPPPSLISRLFRSRCVFRSCSSPQFCASQVTVSCQPTSFGFAPFQPLSVASRLFSLSPLVLCHSSHCRLPADFFLFRPLSCAIQATVSCQPTSFGFAPGFVPSRPLSVASRLFSSFAPHLVPSRTLSVHQPTPNVLRWGSNPCLYRNLVRNQRVSSH